MIVTNDDALARELRSLRHWGDRTIDFGVRDTNQLAWNGRMSEIVAAVVQEQLRGYPEFLVELRDRVSDFQRFLGKFDGIELVLGTSQSVYDSAFTQVVLRIDERRLGRTKTRLTADFTESGIAVWNANFELIPSLSFFRENLWRPWILAGDIEGAAKNYSRSYPTAEKVFASTGIGIGKSHFQSAARLKELKAKMEAWLSS